MSARSSMDFLLMMTAGWAGDALAKLEHGPGDPESTIFKLLIIPLGVATFVAIVTTLTLGLKMAGNRAAIFPWHRRMAISTMLLALCHATLVIIFHRAWVWMIKLTVCGAIAHCVLMNFY